MTDRDFATLIRVCRKAFELRKPDAREKVTRLRDGYLAEALALRRRAAAPRKRGDGHVPAETQHMVERAEELGENAEELDAVLEAFKHANLIGEREDAPGPTPEAATKPERGDPLSRLVEKGRLEPRHEDAGKRIAEVFLAVTRALRVRARAIEVAGKLAKRCGRPAYTHMPDRIADLHSRVYLPWVGAMKADRKQNLPLVMDVAVDGYALGAACVRRRVGYRKGLRQLREGLEMFADLHDATARRAP